MIIVPYIEQNGSWTMADDYVKNLYRLMEEEKTAKRVFHAGGVKSAAEFLPWMKSPAIHAMLIVDDDLSPLILSWISGVEDRRAWYNFNVFKAGWGTRSQELSIAARDYWLNMKDKNGQFIFEILLGLTPDNNRLALRMAEKCGAKRVGTVPNFATNYWNGKRAGAVISYIERR